MTLEEFSNRLYKSKVLHNYKDGKIDYRKVHDWIISQEEAITVTHCCKNDSEQLFDFLEWFNNYCTVDIKPNKEDVELYLSK